MNLKRKKNQIGGFIDGFDYIIIKTQREL